jgi:Family of unknown function (DUF6399)
MSPRAFDALPSRPALSKSSVHRLTQAMERRNSYPESWFWETADGRQWLTRLVVATLYTFGLKRGVGLDTISEFFCRLHLETQLGCSPSALRGVMQALEAALLETAAAWEQDGQARGEVREIIGAVDETFLERMLLVFMDLSTGYLVLEEVADDRTYATWKVLVEERLKVLGTGVLYVVSDRAKALIQLAKQGLECLSVPDFFHVVHELIKSSSRAIGQHLKQAHQQLQGAEQTLARYREHTPGAHASAQLQAAVEAGQTEVRRWEEVHSTSRHHLETLSLTLHPFTIADSVPQTSAQVQSQLRAEGEAIAALVVRHELPTCRDAIKKVQKQLPGLAALVDLWWHGVRQDLAPFVLSPMWQRWVEACLLPLVYWQHQTMHTRCTRKKAKMIRALETVRAAFARHVITQRLAPAVLADWQAWALERVRTFQRTSSAVEGRNGYLSGLHHQQRGLPKQRYKVWRLLHNFDCHAADGTTPASRFFRRSFSDLFETVVSHIDTLPRPRQRKHNVVLSHCNHESVPL